MVCLPKNEGRLGIINLKKHNEAIMLKTMDTFFNKRDITWST